MKKDCQPDPMRVRASAKVRGQPTPKNSSSSSADGAKPPHLSGTGSAPAPRFTSSSAPVSCFDPHPDDFER